MVSGHWRRRQTAQGGGGGVLQHRQSDKMYLISGQFGKFYHNEATMLGEDLNLAPDPLKVKPPLPLKRFEEC